MPTTTSTILDQISAEKTKVSERLARLDTDRATVATQLTDLDDPLLILADEPTGNLDTVASANVQRILMDLARDYGRAVVVVTHDRDFAAAADRVIVMSDGKILSSA